MTKNISNLEARNLASFLTVAGHPILHTSFSPSQSSHSHDSSISLSILTGVHQLPVASPLRLAATASSPLPSGSNSTATPLATNSQAPPPSSSSPQSTPLPSWPIENRGRPAALRRHPRLLKKLLKSIIAPTVNIPPVPAPRLPLPELQVWFVAILTEEVKKFNYFYVGKEEDLIIRFQDMEFILGELLIFAFPAALSQLLKSPS
ncbi:hypothetical protein ACS0TY_033608 [Phlomoides rotata]